MSEPLTLVVYALIAVMGGIAGGMLASWRTWRDVFVEIRDHGWRDDE